MELERVKSEEWLAYCQTGLQVPIFFWVKTEIEKGLSPRTNKARPRISLL